MEPDRQLAEAIEAVRAAHFDQHGHACRYPAFAVSRERGRLAAFLASFEALDFKRMRIPAQTSFWINVFNGCVLRDSPELEFATKLRDVQQFFEQPRLKIGGTPTVFETISPKMIAHSTYSIFGSVIWCARPNDAIDCSVSLPANPIAASSRMPGMTAFSAVTTECSGAHQR